jgi:hypothetical protein
MTGGYVKIYVFTYVVDMNTSHTPEEGAHSPSWPNAYYHHFVQIALVGSY